MSLLNKKYANKEILEKLYKILIPILTIVFWEIIDRKNIFVFNVLSSPSKIIKCFFL